MTNITLPKPPQAVLDAEQALVRAMEAYEKREEEVNRELQRIADERAALKLNWPGTEREAERNAMLRNENKAIRRAETILERAKRRAADEWAPAIAAALEAAIDEVGPAAAAFQDALTRAEVLRHRLDELEGTNPGLRGFVLRLPNTRAIPTVPNANPATLARRGIDTAEQARPAARAVFELAQKRAGTKPEVLDALARATTYAEVRAIVNAILNDREVGA